MKSFITISNSREKELSFWITTIGSNQDSVASLRTCGTRWYSVDLHCGAVNKYKGTIKKKKNFILENIGTYKLNHPVKFTSLNFKKNACSSQFPNCCCCCSVAKPCATLCNLMNHNTPVIYFPIYHTKSTQYINFFPERNRKHCRFYMSNIF